MDLDTEQMANENNDFWFALLSLDRDPDQRVRLWNGYLDWKLPPETKGEGKAKEGWPKLAIHPPSSGWPELTEEDKYFLDRLASGHGGHPEWGHEYMDFSGQTFSEDADFSKLILVHSKFDNARFEGAVKFSKETRFYAQSSFTEVIFESAVYCFGAQFEAPVYFDGSSFKSSANFCGVEFGGGASFAVSIQKSGR